MKDKIRDWWNRLGYGIDEFGVFLIIICVLMWIISIFAGNSFFIASLIALLIAIFRMISRDYYHREKENLFFKRLEFRVRNFFRLKANRYTLQNDKSIQEDSAVVVFIKNIYYKVTSCFSVRRTRDYIIYKCPDCNQRIRVPSGKGKISITCPKCKKSFIKVT